MIHTKKSKFLKVKCLTLASKIKHLSLWGVSFFIVYLVHYNLAKIIIILDFINEMDVYVT